MLDVIGDLNLIGYPFIGSYKGVIPGHEINNLLARELLRRKECWDFVYLS